MHEFARPLAQALDPKRYGRRTGMLAVLAADSDVPVAPGFVIPVDAAAQLLTGLAADGLSAAARPPMADHMASLEAAWRAIGSPPEVTIRVDATANGSRSDPDLPLPSVQAHLQDAGTLLHHLHAALAQFAERPTGPDNGAPAESGNGALLVQRAATAWVRGIAYSEDPRQDRVEEFHVDAWSGGAPLRSSGHSAVGPAAHYRLARDGERIVTEAESGADVALPTSVLLDVIAVLERAEVALGEAITLGWMWTDDGLWTVDVDALTAPLPWAIDRDPPQPHDSWTRANAGEVFPKPVTPMTWSLSAQPLDHGFASLYLNREWTRDRRFVSLRDGYLYFNFGLIYHLNVDRLGAPSRHTQEAVGGAGAAEGLRVTDRGVSAIAMLRHLPLILRTMRRQQRIPREWPAQQKRVERVREDLARLDKDVLGDEELLQALIASGERLDSFLDFFMEAQGAAYTTFTILSYLLDRFLAGGGLAMTLVQGLSNNRTAEGNLALSQLAERATEDRRAADVVRDTAPRNLLQTLRSEPATTWLAHEIDAYLAAFGHRSAGELELMEPRWSDDPAPLLKTFRSHVSNPAPVSAAKLMDRQVRRRLEAEREIDKRLTAHWWERVFPARRALVRYFTKWAQRYTPLRENPKFHLLRVVQEQRRILLTLADRLVDRGVLREPTDIFFLFKDELERLVRSQRDALTVGRLRSRIRRRRAQYAIYSEQMPPAVWGSGLPGAPPSPSPASATELLTGLGASIGVAQGAARVATSVEEVSDLAAGEILVAKFTDPGWTPLFPLAGAVVTEIGGMLSHGAIVAREFGIPAVVNVRAATQRIATGRQIRVDGAAGTVELL